MHIKGSDSPENDVIRQSVSPLSAGASTARKAVMTVLVYLHSAHTVVASDKRSTKPETYSNAKFVIPQAKS